MSILSAFIYGVVFFVCLVFAILFAEWRRVNRGVRNPFGWDTDWSGRFEVGSGMERAPGTGVPGAETCGGQFEDVGQLPPGRLANRSGQTAGVPPGLPTSQFKKP